MRRHLGRGLLLAAALLLPAAASAAERLSVAVLQFGTVSWQLDAMTANGLDQAEGLELELRPLASGNATTVALQAGDVDLIVSDWVWVMRQRAAGSDLVFVPYSSALGALMVAPDSKIASLRDLAGKRLGVAGGPIDKSWLVLRAWSRDRLGFDLAEQVAPIFGAPPLLSEQLRGGRVDAVLTFWHFAARLEAAGFRRLAGVAELMTELGLTEAPPLVGYVFHDALARERPAAVEGFFRALAATNELLRRSDEEWLRLRPLMRAESEAEFQALKARYREGIPPSLSFSQEAEAAALYKVLETYGGDKLLGAGTVFDPKAFWTP